MLCLVRKIVNKILRIDRESNSKDVASFRRVAYAQHFLRERTAQKKLLALRRRSTGDQNEKQSADEKTNLFARDENKICVIITNE